MTWIKIGDDLREHPKWADLGKGDLQLRLYARALWFDALVWCGKVNNDGVLPESMLPVWVASSGIPAKVVDGCVRELCRVKLWRARPKAKGGGWAVHDWAVHQPSKQQVRAKQEKTADHDWLHKTAAGKRVKEKIRRRDGDWCRYCGVPVDWSDRVSPARGSYDILDPDSRFDRRASPDAATIEANAALVVVACGYCNAVKNKRTPAEADMKLRPAPGMGPTRAPSREQVGTGSELARELGPGLVGPEQVGPDRVSAAPAATSPLVESFHDSDRLSSLTNCEPPPENESWPS